MRKQSSKERPSLELKPGAIDPEAGRDSLWSIVDYEVTESGNFEIDSQCQQQPGTVLPDSRHQIHKFPTVQKANSSFSNLNQVLQLQMEKSMSNFKSLLTRSSPFSPSPVPVQRRPSQSRLNKRISSVDSADVEEEDPGEAKGEADRGPARAP